MTSKYTPVRIAVPEDRVGIEELCLSLHAENGLFALSGEKLQTTLDRAFNKKGAIIGVIGDIGNPVATIYLGITQFFYSDEWMLMEEWAFVHPDFRRSNYARSLIHYAKEVSDQLQLPLLTGILSNKRTEAKIRLYGQELECAGAYFIYNRRYSAGANW